MVDITSANPDDRLSKSKTLYDASTSEIILKNFLAGFSRTLGGLVLYFLFVFILGAFFVRFALPIITPFLNQLNTINSSLQKIPKF